MEALLTDLNVHLLGLKPFHFNLFKVTVIGLCITLVWLMLVSATVWRCVLRGRDGLDGWSMDRHRLLAWSLGGLFSAFLIYLRARQYVELQTWWDMTTEANVAWHMVHGPWFFNSLDNRSLLGQHFSPVMLLIGLVYRLAEHPLTLLVIQSLALGLGVVAVYEIVLARCDRKSMALLAVLLYLFNPYLHHVTAHDFHRSPIAIPTVLWLLVFIESGRLVPAAALSLLALSIEESIPLPLAGFGLYLAVFRPTWRVFGLSLAVLSIGYFFLVAKVFLPMFTPEQGLFFWDRYAHLGRDFNEAFLNIMLNPFWALTEALVRHNQYIYLAYFLIPVALLPLFAWREACLLVVPLATMLLSQNDGQYKLGFHYSAPALPFLFYSAVCGLALVSVWIQRDSAKAMMRWKGLLVGIVILTGLNVYRCPGYDLGKTDPVFVAAAFEAAALIPSDAAVAADVRLAPLVVNRHRICKIGLDTGTVCDWTPVGAQVLPRHGLPDPGWSEKQSWVPEYVIVGSEPTSANGDQIKRRRAYVVWLVATQGYAVIYNQREVTVLRGSGGASVPVVK